MSTDWIPTIFLCTSQLLAYPDHSWREVLPELRETVTEIKHRQIQNNLVRFLDYVDSVESHNLIDLYVTTFDFGKKTNLYLTYLHTGEQRERGIELLELKQYYLSKGWDVTDKELPDYLPLMLQFASIAPVEDSKSLLLKYQPNIEELRKQLIANENPYVIVIDCVLMGIEELRS